MFHGLKAHAPARECRELIRRRLRHLLPEVFQHGLHERGVEGVGHRQWPASDPRHLSHLKQRVSKAAGRTQVVGDLSQKNPGHFGFGESLFEGHLHTLESNSFRVGL